MQLGSLFDVPVLLGLSKSSSASGVATFYILEAHEIDSVEFRAL